MTKDELEHVTLSDGARLATWTRAGRPGEPAAILLHGRTAEDELGPLAELIGAEASTYRYERIAGPKTSQRSADSSISAHVADLEELRRHWGLERVVLIGHSSGSALALAYAAAHVDRVGVIGLLGGVGIGVGAGSEVGVADADLIGWAAAIACPVYFVHGTADPVSAAHALLLADRTSIARKRVVIDAGHRPWIEQPEAVRELLIEIVRAAR